MQKPAAQLLPPHLPDGEPCRAIEGYVKRYLKRTNLPARSMRLSLQVFESTRHAPDGLINTAGDLARAYLEPARGTLLVVYTEGNHLVYERPAVTESVPALAA
ncbi:MAG: hypothetical protein ACR2GR_09010 [Rhodothermales bacterium]